MAACRATELGNPPVKPYSGRPMSLGNAAAAKVRLIVWCKPCGYQAQPDDTALVERHGADMPVFPSGAEAAMLALRQSRR